MNTTEEKQTPAQIEQGLAGFSGSEQFHRYNFGLILTDGVKFLADSCQAYWLLDVIASYQFDRRIRGDEGLRAMQFWQLDVKDGKGKVTLYRDTDDEVLSQTIHYTDFPLASVRVWLANKTMMLPSEY